MENAAEYYRTPQVKKIAKEQDFTKHPEPQQIPASEYKTSDKPLPPQQKQSFEDLWQQATVTPKNKK